MRLREFGGLTGPYLEPKNDGDATSVMMLLHGWGANGNDLVDLTQPFAIRFPKMAFFLPNGPESCKMNPAGREWFDIEDRTYGPDQAAPVINNSITSLLLALELEASSLVLVGFSQGGMMGLHCGLRMYPTPAAIISFSGALLRHNDLQELPKLSYPPVQLVHGTDDQVVAFKLMAEAVSSLQPLGVKVSTVERPGLGHGIDADGLSASMDFLNAYVPN